MSALESSQVELPADQNVVEERAELATQAEAVAHEATSLPRASLLDKTLKSASTLLESVRVRAEATATAVEESLNSAWQARLTKGAGISEHGPTEEPIRTSTEQQANMSQAFMEAAAGLTKRTKEGGVAAYHAALESIRKLTSPTRRVAAVCKADLRTKPCPQTILLCCNLICQKGLHSHGLFNDVTDPAAMEQVAHTLQRLEDRMLLLPPDMDPIIASSVVKHFLLSLEEPLLTYRLSQRWVLAGSALVEGTSKGAAVQTLLSELPLVNWSTLRLLIETCYHVASQFNNTGMNAFSLATELAPALLWYDIQPVAAPLMTDATADKGATAAGGPGMVAQAAAAMQALRTKLLTTATTAAAAAAAAGDVTSGIDGEGDAAAKYTVTDDQDTAERQQQQQQEEKVGDQEEGEKIKESSDGPATAEDERQASGGGQVEVTHMEKEVVSLADTPAPQAEEAIAADKRVALAGQSLEAVITLLEYMILNYDDVFYSNK